MAKKNKNRSAKKATRHSKSGHSPASSSSAVSLSSYRAERALAPLVPGFVDWFAQSFGPTDQALVCLKVVTAATAAYFEEAGIASATAFEPGSFAAVLEMIGESDPDRAPMIFSVLHLFIDFLHESGNWSGTEADYDAVHALVREDDTAPGMPVITVPELSEEDAAAALEALPLIQRARALLEWLGDGKPVTATGVLRLKDIEAAAACVGVSARGASKRQPATEEVIPGLAELSPEQASPEAMTVQSMHDIPLLSQIWNTFIETEMIEVLATKAIPHGDPNAFLGGSPSEMADDYRFFIGEFLRDAVLETGGFGPWEESSAILQVAVLAAATTDDPPEVDRLLAAEDYAPEDEKAMAGIVTRMSFTRLKALAELGLLEIDTHIRVPAPVIQCVAEAFEDEFDLDVVYPEDHPEMVAARAAWAADQAEEREQAAEKRKPAPPSSVYQLKIMLRNSKPPIWRRILVPASVRLDELHNIIQASFEWLDYHLHNFRVGDWPGTLYGPVDPEPFGDPEIDERTVSLHEILEAEGEKFVYTYDFGDDWEHVITLEKVLDPSDGDRLPRCTGGRGQAPREDSGGVWGWMDKVDAVNNPGHPDHEEFREWLGLQRGATIDPKEFDVDGVNESFEALLLTK
ncbi:plasmid pRiA4b ORF-3 family protein [Arthrobacter sp. VKM Ac-2550]|uniref:plasmid pRiA4b ORF-3 family protein n=1 Tax=Crystallibacter permensis TaxID=1938888 RepID=UPI0022273F2C|nr:plasmid pRiA4b ORF-3 family protein [Arthrobacter sp. VKM Ac-2550]MCW2134264.1 pRiA4b ORF-3-like protein [Arthrobacter sp. VKM Ac-2550]